MSNHLDFYSGFEGEPEITFRTLDNSSSITMWEGYFDAIITNDVPNGEGYWEGLALPYHTCAWAEGAPFQLNGLDKIIERLKLCWSPQWNEPRQTVYQALLQFFEKAQQQQETVLVEYF